MPTSSTDDVCVRGARNSSSAATNDASKYDSVIGAERVPR